jgi:hypothetical protein
MFSPQRHPGPAQCLLYRFLICVSTECAATRAFHYGGELSLRAPAGAEAISQRGRGRDFACIMLP